MWRTNSLKRPWCWKILKMGEGDDRGWDGWMASPIQWTWVWVNSRSWWWTGKPGVLQSMGSQRARHDWVTELDWPWLLKRRLLTTRLPGNSLVWLFYTKYIVMKLTGKTGVDKNNQYKVKINNDQNWTQFYYRLNTGWNRITDWWCWKLESWKKTGKVKFVVY